jgi:hypothetical protein
MYQPARANALKITTADGQSEQSGSLKSPPTRCLPEMEEPKRSSRHLSEKPGSPERDWTRRDLCLRIP